MSTFEFIDKLSNSSSYDEVMSLRQYLKNFSGNEYDILCDFWNQKRISVWSQWMVSKA